MGDFIQLIGRVKRDDVIVQQLVSRLTTRPKLGIISIVEDFLLRLPALLE